ncbi:conserved hypothetical protein [Rubrivivax sp. A210]|uniref:hypothetical protein n=1 Tax=Rubrivivax sp. A210 TaxID=2772301 RepID=UPI0019199D9D|nr:hypothetical protein [Rubrivivax sp. A210]CAD5366608.1 conserved hypothetical protein [Rubrivivax sp. A210]
MSQHYFRTRLQGEPVTVVLGWSRPLHQFFLIVERPEPKPGQDDYVYIDQDDSRRDLPHFAAKLEELGIEVPRAMFEQVQLDPVTTGFDRVVSYQLDGGFTSAALHTAVH